MMNATQARWNLMVLDFSYGVNMNAPPAVVRTHSNADVRLGSNNAWYKIYT